jgi:hypothetical protein
MMARPGYLSRRDGGRYFLQIRVGNQHAALYGRNILRASLRTGDFAEARRRLVDNLAWVQELVAAPDLDAIGGVIDRRLQGYTAAGVPQTERGLAERVAVEHQVRHYIARANERGYAFSRVFEGFASRWVDFVDQNKAAEGELAQLGRRQEYERGRGEATTAVALRLGADDRLTTPRRSVDGARHAGNVVGRGAPDHRCQGQGRDRQADCRPHRLGAGP